MVRIDLGSRTIAGATVPEKPLQIDIVVDRQKGDCTGCFRSVH